jgi:signal transduction histidine kinase
MIHDITQVKDNLRLQEEINVSNQMAGYMNHEMITPLQCVAQLVDRTLDSGRIDFEIEGYLNIINSTIKLLLTTIKHNLDVSMLKVN